MSVISIAQPIRTRAGRVVTVVACAAAALAVAACGDSGSSGGSATASASSAAVKPPSGLLQSGSITFGTDFTFPPYEAITNGQQQGFDVEFGKLLAKEMGIQAKFVDNRFASLIPALQAHKFDAILSAMYITAERLKQVRFVPYFNTGNVIVVKKGGAYQPKTPLDLCGHVFSIQEGAYVEQVARTTLNDQCKAKGTGPIKVRSFQTDTASFQEVAAGRADVTFGDSAVSLARLKDNPKLGLQISSDPGQLFYPTPGGVAVRASDADVRRALTEAVAKLQAGGQLDSLRKRYGLAAPDAKQGKAAEQAAEK